MATLLLLSIRRLPKLNVVMLAFVLVFLGQLAFSLGGTVSAYYLFSHTNHLIQFIFYYYAFVHLATVCDWRAIWMDRRFMLAAAGVLALESLFGLVQWGSPGFSEFNLALFGLVAGLFMRGQRGKRLTHFLILIAICLPLALISSRASFSVILALILVLYWVDLPEWTIRALATVILAGPIVLYLALPPDALRWLYALDHNSGIRADFVRGAWYYLQNSPIFGIGFEAPYRPTNFNYATEHPYLNSLFATQIISNHHSLFDVALRMGLPAAALLWWAIFMGRRLRAPARIHAVLYLVLAIGLSFNAWLENQGQLPVFALLAAMLYAERRTVGRRLDVPDPAELSHVH
ncbi:MAG: O-antigen ligase family protein [Cucumibacter sp.]